MPRKKREWLEGSIYHLFSRGSNRQAIFLSDGDLVEFDMLLHETANRHQLETFGWALQTNHWHLVAACPPQGLSAFVKSLNHRYALRFDRRWGRTAHVFQARFGAVLQVSEEQFLWTLRYVVRNPVEAGICSSPFDAQWTSFAATAGLERPPAHLRVERILEHFGRTPDEARTSYVEFVLGVDATRSSDESRRAKPVVV